MLFSYVPCARVVVLFSLLQSCAVAMANSVVIDRVPDAGETFYEISSAGKLQLDPKLSSLMPAVGVYFNAVAPATYDSAQATVNTTISSLTYDESSNKIISLQTVGGGVFNMPSAFSVFGIKVGGPGSISFTNLTINLNTKMVSASIFGSNGVSAGTFDIFSFQNFSGDSIFGGAKTYTFQATQLALTTTGVNAVGQALGLTATGRSALASVTNLGSMSGTIAIGAIPVTPPAVPEPSSLALMALGFLGIAIATHFRYPQLHDKTVPFAKPNLE